MKQIDSSKMIIPQSHGFSDCKIDDPIKVNHAKRHYANLEKCINKHSPEEFYENDMLAISRHKKALSKRKLQYMNPYARDDWHRILQSVCDEAGIADMEGLCMFTIIDRDWFQCEKTFAFGNDVKQKMKKKIQAALSGMNYIGMIEFACYTNVIHKGHGQLISPHFHGITWGVDKQKSEFTTARGRFGGGLGDSIGVHAKTIKDGELDKVINYCVKAPSYGYRYNPNAKRRSNMHTMCELSMAKRYRIFKLFKDYRFPQFLVSGGELGEALACEARYNRAPAESRWRC